MNPPPIVFLWSGSAMEPVHRRIADKHFVVGERYRLEIIEERSARTHAHFFACLHDIWMSLPEDAVEEYPTETHLRKKALIKCGFADERSIVCSSAAEALRLAAFIQPMDSFAIVSVRRNVVKVFTAQSQSMKAMGKKTFQESKQKVLDYCASLIGVTADEVKRNQAA